MNIYLIEMKETVIDANPSLEMPIAFVIAAENEVKALQLLSSEPLSDGDNLWINGANWIMKRIGITCGFGDKPSVLLTSYQSQ